ncbi:MAG: hypothetical protein GW858_08175 [Sphingomonadales bacterium]|nr:hypothetical protein [Sphingomonadales bacterium]NCQ20485.1 hypothetical protein [Sphingomonadales bacterium]NCT03093.1 hypothetical protein [Sphingomonadales bacterium]
MRHTAYDLIARGDAFVVAQPDAPATRHQVDTDRNFGLPSALYGITVSCYLGFLVIVGTAFANPGLAIPLAIFALFIVAGFGVPAIWTRLAGNTTAPQTLGAFGRSGIMTSTGRLAPRDATIQVLILPVLLVVWGLAVALIAAVVT